MAQYSKGDQIFFPDGCRVDIKGASDPSWTTLGCILGDTAGKHNFDVNVVECNDGTKSKQYRNETIAMSFILGNLNADNVAKMSAGMFSVTTTAGTPFTPVDQVISAGWTDKSTINIDMKATTTSNSSRTTAEPVITTVTAATAGVLVEDDDYTIVPSSNAPSGWEIVINTVGGISGVLTSEEITIAYGSNTPIARTTITGGKSSGEFTNYAVRFVHVDSTSKERFMEIYSVNPESGSFAFSFRAVATGEIEQLPLTLTGELDGTRSNGDQLFNWGYDDGAA